MPLVSWKKESAKWLAGNIPNEVDKGDVEGWLRHDPVWNRADQITWSKGGGSHIAKVHIKGMGHLLKRWDADVFDISTTGGRWVKKWIIEQLVKAYRELEEL